MDVPIFGQGRFMSILSAHSPHRFDLFRRSMIQGESLPLTEVLSDSLVEDAFQERNVSFGIADEDVFTPAITLWAMVSQFLFSGTGRSCKAAAGRVVSLYAQLTGRVVAQNAGNYCRAKCKIPVEVIRKITLDVAKHVELRSASFDDLSVALGPEETDERICPPVMAAVRGQSTGGRIINVDGFTIDAPDTAENQAAYPQNPSQQEGLGFPILRCVCLISMVTGMLCHLAVGPYSGKGSGETNLLRKLKGYLRRGDILVADSYYCTYWLLAMCNEIGVQVVMKNHHRRDDHPLGARRLSETERIDTLLRPTRPQWMKQREYRRVPRTLDIRLCDILVNRAGSRSEGFTAATTMMDHALAPAKWIASLYEGRWLVETDIRSLKCTLGLEHLRSRTPEGIERELWTGLLAYNLIRLKMLQSGYAATRDIRSMSFSETYQLLSTNWLLCACCDVNSAMATAAQAQGTCAIVGIRPGREEPRANKRRPKMLKLMTLPRKLLRAAIGAVPEIP
jgi:hypothetical protein